jgi:hypothetical protein
MELPSINMVYKPPKPNIVYQQTVIKAVIKVNDQYEQETLYTYSKSGQLISTIVRKHDLGSI